MEEVDKDPEEASERSVLSENQETKSGVSTQSQEVQSVEANDEFKGEEVEESEKMITPQRIIDLQRDLQKSVTNIQTATDAKESMRRRELEEARKLRLERLENDMRSSQEKFDEITRGWLTAKEKATPQELQEALNDQQQLCAALIDDKKKLINDLQQELRAGDDRYVKDLRRHAEELDLMMERMEEQVKTLTQAYREELAQIERVYQQESEVLLTRDKTEWEQSMKELLDKELEWLAQRQKTVEEYEVIIHNLMWTAADRHYALETEQNTRFQELEREHQKIKMDRMLINLKQNEQFTEVATRTVNLKHMQSRLASLQAELKNLQAKCSSQVKEFRKKSQYLSEECKRNIQRYDCVQRKIKHFVAADSRKFEEMWLMIEEEVKELVEKALDIDSLICRQQLGLAWERPSMVFIKPQKQMWRPTCQAASQSFQTRQALQCSESMMDASVWPRLKTETASMDMEMFKEGTAVQSESGAEVGRLSIETVKKVMELLCDEAGFLMEDKLLNLLAPLEKDEQTVVKLTSLLCSFGLEEVDVPRLAHFFMKYRHQQREQTEVRRERDASKIFLIGHQLDVCVESSESSDKAEEVETNSELIDPHHFVPALKSFLEHLTRSRESSAHQHVETWDTSQDEAYWDTVGHIISEDKLKLWDAAEITLNQYHSVLTEISKLVPETQSLEQQNKELRMLLQNCLESSIQEESTELKMF
ncbi:dynein regulatory complex protein 1 [Symphorus nematophorus]